MTIATVQQTLLLYSMEKANITQDLEDIMNKITSATSKSTDLMASTNEKRTYYAQLAEQNPEMADTTEYKNDVAAVESDYQLQLAEINAWESQLEQQKNHKETELKAVTSFEESWTAVLKKNIQNDFKYGQGTGS